MGEHRHIEATERALRKHDLERYASRRREQIAWTALLVWALMVIGFTAIIWLSSSARAQSTPDDATLLARSCVSERGWRHETDDCAAIADVVRTRMASHGQTFAAALSSLAPRLHRGLPIGRTWLQDLHPDGRRPRGWRRASWTRRRADWLATLEHARAILAGEVASRCAEPPRAWGSRLDVRAGERRGHVWRSIDCGETRNLFGRWETRR